MASSIICEDYIMKLNVRTSLLLCAIAATLSGVAGLASAAPTLFTATATVQNAITINQVTALNFGTVFATTTVLGAVGADATYSNKLTLSSAGVVTATTGAAAGPQVLSLGGAVAGSYSAPGLPSNATVRVLFTNASTLAVTPAASVAAASCLYDTPAAALAANKVALVHSSADPTIGFFCVDVFTSNRAGLFTVGGYALGVGVSTLTFDLGATLVTQAPITAITRTFATGTYTGTVGMEITFP